MCKAEFDFNDFKDFDALKFAKYGNPWNQLLLYTYFKDIDFKDFNDLKDFKDSVHYNSVPPSPPQSRPL